MTDIEYIEKEYDLVAGWIDDEGNVHDTVVLREMTGAEEDIFIDRDYTASERLEKVLSRCVQKIGGVTDDQTIERAVEEMVVGDRTVLMIRLRQLSVGNEFRFQVKCPEEDCRFKQSAKVDLSALETREIDDPEERQYKVELPRTGLPAILRIPTGKEMKKVQQRNQQQDNESSRMSQSMVARIAELDGEEATVPDLKKLPHMDRVFLRNQVDGEPGIDTEIFIECRDCLTEFKTELDVTDREFFFPSDI